MRIAVGKVQPAVARATLCLLEERADAFLRDVLSSAAAWFHEPKNIPSYLCVLMAR
jgi:hypothetical protein